MDDREVIEQTLAGLINTETVAKQWEQAFKEEILANAFCEQISDEEVMSDVYQQILLSPAVGSLLDQEYDLSIHLKELADKQEHDWQELTLRQTEELQHAVDLLTEREVNEVSVRHCEERQMFESAWESKMVNVQETQKLHFRELLLGMVEIVATGGQLPVRPAEDPEDQATNDQEQIEVQDIFRLEESFTIQLGAQMKQSHNLRLICADVFDLCRLPLKNRNDPERLQMALSLYSTNLSGLVLLVDDRLSAFTGMEKEFLRICKRSAELHFPRADIQLENARNSFATNALGWREQIVQRRSADSNVVKGKPKTPRPGDMYISRHSNLAQVHVVFHLVSDDSVRSADINSRHPVLLGLRNVLRTAVMSDVTTLTIPLLLVHELSEEMTVPWCLRRAELVFKCVKGFMMELASYGSNADATARGASSSPTLQFLLPRDAADEVFHSLTAMLPGVFRISNPLVLRSDSSR